MANELKISPDHSPFPLSSGFLLSWLQGYFHTRTILEPKSKSAAWGITWQQFCAMASTEIVGQVSCQDFEMVWMNWEWLPRSEYLQARVVSLQEMISEWKTKSAGMVLPLHVDRIKWWIVFLVDFQEARLVAELFRKMYEDGENSKGQPNCFLGPKESELESSYYMTLKTSHIKAKGPIYQPNSQTPYHPSKPLKPFIISGKAKNYNKIDTNIATSSTGASIGGVMEFSGGLSLEEATQAARGIATTTNENTNARLPSALFPERHAASSASTSKESAHAAPPFQAPIANRKRSSLIFDEGNEEPETKAQKTKPALIFDE